MEKQISILNKPDTALRDDGSFVFHYPPKFTWSRDLNITPKTWGDYHVYFHVPFCRQICTFCTFERKQLKKGALDHFVKLLHKEIDIVKMQDDFTQSQIQSVYFGGGTASLLPNREVIQVIDRMASEFDLGSVEVTLECEPGTKRVADFKTLLYSGVNRISIGVQALQDHHLTNLNRSHDALTSLKMIEQARTAGCVNLHVDLMYGLPDHRFDEWKYSLDTIISLNPDHISIYPLIVFDKELLQRKILSGTQAKIPSSAERNDMQLYTLEQLTSRGYRRYSLTEFCKPGFECRYVISNWNGADYIGFGPGSYSRNKLSLWENDVIHSQYEEKIEKKLRPIGKTRDMTLHDGFIRDVVQGLCLLSINEARLLQYYNFSVANEFEVELEYLLSNDLMNRDGLGNLNLTDKGIRYATQVMKTFSKT